MTDRERAVALLEAAGFRPLPERGGTSWAPSVWFDRERGNIRENVVVDAQGKVVYRAEARIPDLPAILSPLTLEMVEEAVNKTRTEVGSWENAECRVGAFIALDNLMKRLRQQMGGGQ